MEVFPEWIAHLLHGVTSAANPSPNPSPNPSQAPRCPTHCRSSANPNDPNPNPNPLLTRALTLTRRLAALPAAALRRGGRLLLLPGERAGLTTTILPPPSPSPSP
eukprot:scaffold5219_cov47-Phaeocystis_antarctica.AAC.2